MYFSPQILSSNNSTFNMQEQHLSFTLLLEEENRNHKPKVQLKVEQIVFNFFQLQFMGSAVSMR